MTTPPSNQSAQSSGAASVCASWFCYILRCADGTLYTGVTNDMDRRLAGHNAGTAAKYTRSRRPVALVFVESCVDRSAALRREMKLKGLSRADKLALVAGEQTP